MMAAIIGKIYKEKRFSLINTAHLYRYVVFNIQTVLVYPIWTMHLKLLHTPAEKFVGLIVAVYFCSDLIGNMTTKFNHVPDLNELLVSIMGSGEMTDHAGHIFMGCILQAVIMSRWNLAWIFCDIALDSNFHRQCPKTRESILRRQSAGVGLMSPGMLGNVGMADTNFVEVWIIGIWTAYGILHLWIPRYELVCVGLTTSMSFIAMIIILFGDSKRMRGHVHSTITSACEGF